MHGEEDDNVFQLENTVEEPIMMKKFSKFFQQFIYEASSKLQMTWHWK